MVKKETDERLPFYLEPDEERLWGTRERGRKHTRVLLRKISELRERLKDAESEMVQLRTDYPTGLE